TNTLANGLPIAPAIHVNPEPSADLMVNFIPRTMAVDDLIGREARRSFIRDNFSHWTDVLRELIRRPSPFEEEHALVSWIEGHIQSLGVMPQRVKHEPSRLRQLTRAQHPISPVPDRHSLAVRMSGANGGRSIILNAHVDVVPEGDATAWTYPPYAGYIDALHNIIYGRGAVDDKAGEAISLALLECMLRLPLQLAGDGILQFVLEDETTGSGSLLFLEAGPVAEAAISREGTRPERALNEHAGH